MAKPAKKKLKKQPVQPQPPLQPKQPEVPVLVPARKKKKSKKRRAAVVKQKPLPPPVEPAAESRDPFQLAATFNPGAAGSRQPSASSSIFNEPKPGQPLTKEQEQIIGESFAEIGVEDPAPSDVPVGASEGAAVADMLPEIAFDPVDVQDVLREGFHWIAERFDSAHWELTETQARMLGKPTAQLLSTLYSRLPDFLTRWCDSTPGLAGLCVTGAIVIGPKVAQQVAITRERRKSPAPKRGPHEVPRRAPAGPVGPIIEAEPIADQ